MLPLAWLKKAPRESVPDCCRRQAKAAPSTNKCSASFNVYDGISYRFVDGTAKRRLSSTVGGQRVPFEVAQVQSLRRKRDFLVGLSSIEEEKHAMCESCHSYTFSRLSKTKCITLTMTSATKPRKPTKETRIRQAAPPQPTDGITCA
ncbi:hypothetical protein H310_08541 [Aphanomyces invadans]|uniref:Uncharacterized protein n=1 Tax=Aphanomyces invadans TaxID=157072 RepID=A0A024U0I7_9STRA|nr:hypothetical protein H310_08541 [Aphanomyces invadans]ETV99132.1 hypothetical protein H310_08541 [Aphanomyces invadans]|eukprot:XP_008872560.1 hypothetical protein H310_08541 [Aphanomyces invadans]